MQNRFPPEVADFLLKEMAVDHLRDLTKLVLGEETNPLGIHWLSCRLHNVLSEARGYQPIWCEALPGEHAESFVKRLIRLAKAVNSPKKYPKRSVMGQHNCVLVIAEHNSDPDKLLRLWKAQKVALDTTK